MCGSGTSDKRLLATGILNSLKRSDWIDVAEELADLSAEDFRKLMRAFELYRDAKSQERITSNEIPPRGRKRAAPREEKPAARTESRNQQPPPEYPDTRFEADLRSFLKASWPDTPFASDITEVARAAFYKGYRSPAALENLPSGVSESAVRFAREKLAKRGLRRSSAA